MLIESQLKRLGFGTAALFLLIVATLIGVEQMYLMTVIIVLMPVLSWAANKLLKMGLTVVRSAPPTANQRSRHPVDLIIQNNSRVPKFFLRFNDSLPRQIRYGGTTDREPSFIPVLWPGEKATVRYFIEPVTRGAHNVGPLTISGTDMLGFTTARAKFGDCSEVLVYPEILPVSPTVMSTGAAVGLRDDQDARSKGNGTDFSGVREYREGDELRRINWKSTARTGSLVVTEYSQGFASDITVILDCGRDAYSGSQVGEISPFEYAVKIAVAFATTALSRGSKVTLISNDGESENTYTTRRLMGVAGVSELLEIMARVTPNCPTSLLDVVSSIEKEIFDVGAAVVITPEKSDDHSVRGSLFNAFSRHGSSSLQVFWLDTQSFDLLENLMRKGEVTRSAFTPSGSGMFESTALGREYQVEPNTNLVALLGGLAHGG